MLFHRQQNPAGLSIVAVTSQLPWPLDRGGHLRTFHLLGGLAASFDVRLVTVCGDPEAVKALESVGVAVRTAGGGKRRHITEARRFLTAAARSEPYVLYRRHYRAAVWALLEQELRSRPPDVLYLDHLDSLMYAGRCGDTTLACDLHNVYSLLAWRAADETESLARRLYLRRESRLLERMERRAAVRADVLFTVSNQERDYFLELGASNVHVIPNGVDVSRYQPAVLGRSGTAPLLLYVGAMSWLPNVSAARFLASHVLPVVRRHLPGARLRIVGRHPPREVLELAQQDGVEVLPNVEDVAPHFRQADMLAVPLESGGGTRLKILEAFAAGLPVISTPVGCEGLEIQRDRHLVVSAREHFADNLIGLLCDQDRGRRVAAAARELVVSAYDWRVIGQSLGRAIHAAAVQHRAARRPGHAA